VYFHEVWYAFDATENDLDATRFNLVALSIPKLRAFKLLRWMQRNPLIILNRLVDLDEILYGYDEIEDDLDSILFSAVALTIPKWRTFKLLRWGQFLNRLVDLD
jgi:hypothetical protein